MAETVTGLPALSPKRGSALGDNAQQILEINNRAGGLKRKDLMNQTLMVEKDAGGLDFPPSVATDASGRKALNLNSTVRLNSDLGSRT